MACVNFLQRTEHLNEPNPFWQMNTIFKQTMWTCIGIKTMAYTIIKIVKFVRASFLETSFALGAHYFLNQCWSIYVLFFWTNVGQFFKTSTQFGLLN
jgi:hypothetical protein